MPECSLARGDAKAYEIAVTPTEEWRTQRGEQVDVIQRVVDDSHRGKEILHLAPEEELTPAILHERDGELGERTLVRWEREA